MSVWQMRLEIGVNPTLTRMSTTHITSLSQLDKLLGNKSKLTVSRKCVSERTEADDISR